MQPLNPTKSSELCEGEGPKTASPSPALCWQTAMPSAGLRGAGGLSRPSLLLSLASMAQPSLCLTCHSPCFVVHAQGPSLSACVPRMFVSEMHPGRLRSETSRGLRWPALHSGWGLGRYAGSGCPSPRPVHMVLCVCDHALHEHVCMCKRVCACVVCTCACVCLGFGGLSPEQLCQVWIQGSAQHPPPPVGGRGAARYLVPPRDPLPVLQSQVSAPLGAAVSGRRLGRSACGARQGVCRLALYAPPQPWERFKTWAGSGLSL